MSVGEIPARYREDDMSPRLIRRLTLAVVAFFALGCEREVQRITASIDDAVKVIDKQGTSLNTNWSEANGILNNGLASVKDGTIRGEVNLTIDHLQQASA